ncbi:MAG: hypothetical protein JRN32_00150 [Nitrososphaerota archaeon]|nr:hypothetical protein [Nitrososphaerota archaeon]MDG7040216.1 hypothetical protein [Nitrososphaerota archaeon]MDG7045214.1 hypothetical protein [Nitrososphaerota archaeon]MDG7046423.1 hypothetical protein [Nitrososphaerota archaeon]
MYLGEQELQAKRRILSVLLDESRKSVEATRELSEMYSKLAGTNIESYRVSIAQASADLKGSRRALTRNIAEMGTMLLNKEDIMRVAYQFEELVDTVEGASFRLAQLDMKFIHKIGVDRDIGELLEMLVDIVSRINEIVRMLQINPEKTSDLLPPIEDIEKKIDNRYRQVVVQMLNASTDYKNLIITKDLVERIDELSDISLKISDSLIIVSIGI